MGAQQVPDATPKIRVDKFLFPGNKAGTEASKKLADYIWSSEPMQELDVRDNKLQEGENRPNIPLPEKFHRGILQAVRNVSDAL